MTPKAILTGHKAEVSCLAVSAELGIVISGSLGNCAVYCFTFCSLLLTNLCNTEHEKHPFVNSLCCQFESVVC